MIREILYLFRSHFINAEVVDSKGFRAKYNMGLDIDQAEQELKEYFRGVFKKLIPKDKFPLSTFYKGYNLAVEEMLARYEKAKKEGRV